MHDATVHPTENKATSPFIFGLRSAETIYVAPNKDALITSAAQIIDITWKPFFADGSPSAFIEASGQQLRFLAENPSIMGVFLAMEHQEMSIQSVLDALGHHATRKDIPEQVVAPNPLPETSSDSVCSKNSNSCFKGHVAQHFTDIDLLYKAMPLLSEKFTGSTYEEHPAVKAICDAWNGASPADRQAKGFNVYWGSKWSTEFIAGDREEPSTNAEELKSMGDSVMVIEDASIVIAFVFFKGQSEYIHTNGETTVPLAHGERFLSTKTDPERPLDQSIYSFRGLNALLNRMCEIDASSEGEHDWNILRLCGLLGVNI